MDQFYLWLNLEGYDCVLTKFEVCILLRMHSHYLTRLMQIFILLSALIILAHTEIVSSNIPVIVSSTKNYTTAKPQWLTSPFFRAGNEAVIQTLTGNDKTPTYTFTFSSALPGLPNLAYGIKNYRGNDWFGQEFFEIRKIGLSAATFTVAIQIYGVTNLWLLTVAYLAVDPTFPHHLNTFDNVPLNYTAGDIVNITTMRSYQTYYQNYINYTQQTAGLTYTKFQQPYSSNNIVLFITSLWIRASFGSGSTKYPIKLNIYTGIVNQSFYWWNATLSVQVLITNLHFSQIIFNTDDVQASNKYFIVYQIWQNDMNGGFIEIPSAFLDNFIMAVTSFETVDGYCGFQYQWEFTNKTVNGVVLQGVELLLSWTLTNTCGFSKSLSSIFYMQTWLCPPPYYYFNLTSGLCQTYCGGFTYQNQTIYACDPCVNTLCYQCDQPDKNLCTSCASYQFYELVNNTCVCMSGYFAAYSQCLPCSNATAGCLACAYDDLNNGTLAYNSALFTCDLCNNSANYFVNGRFCTLCTLNKCQQCANLTACSVCTTGFKLSVALTCVVCNVVGCEYCSTTNPNQCGICDAVLGYYITAAFGCVTQCGDGIYVTGVEQCDDNNTANYDGCSSTCTIQPSFTCSGSPSVCYFASSVTLALVDTIVEPAICDTITFTFKITPASATFSQPYVNWTSFLITPNASLFTLNTSMLKYTNGNFSASYFLLATIQNQTLDYTFNFSSLIENSTIFANTLSNPLSFVVLPTNNRSADLECCTGYAYNNATKTCIEICGDGMVFDFACDDGNRANGDGCSSTCQIQPSYVCINGSKNTSSVCYYNGTVSVAVVSANKDPTSNSISLSYSISPIQPVLSVINGTDLQPFITVSNPAATITSAAYDPSTGKVSVQITYNSSIQGQPLNLKFNPPNTPVGALLPNISNNWVVSPTNHISATYYPQSTYDKVKKLEPYTTACLVAFLAVSALTVFFRKFVGLQLATLMQMGFLSLLVNDSLPVELSLISDWKYMFGYNSVYFSSKPSRLLIDGPYALYGYEKYFGYSCNVMILAIAAVYGLSIVLLLLSAVTTKSLSRRLKDGGLLLLNEVGFAIVLFCTPNIITAFCVQIKEGTIFDTSVFWSTAFLVIALSALLVSNIINLLNIDDSNEVGTFYRKHSQLGVYCSVVFSVRLVLLTVLVFLKQIIGMLSVYLLIAIQLFYLLFIVIGRPHKKPFDFLRSFTVQLTLLYVLTTRFLYGSVLSSNDMAGSTFAILAMTELAAYGLCVLLTLVSLVYHIAKKFKRNKVRPEDKNQQDGPSPQKMQNQSKMNLAKQLVQDMSPSKRRMADSNSIVFDVEELQDETSPYRTGKTSQLKFDYRREERKYRRKRQHQ